MGTTCFLRRGQTMKKHCGRKYPDHYTYCTQCGAKLEVDLFGELFTEKDKDAFKLYSDAQ